MTAMSEADEQELEMLREFYDCWIAFHSIQRGARQEQEIAAQRLADASNSIKALRTPRPMVLNG